MNVLQEAVELVESSYMTLDEAAKYVGISQVYFRRIVEGKETDDVKLKTLIFGKQVILRTTVQELNAEVTDNRKERDLKAQAKLEEQVNKKSEPKGPTLLDLKLEARELQVPVGRKNKADLIAALEAKRTEILAEQYKLNPALDAEVDAAEEAQDLEDPALALEAVLAE